MAIATKRTKKVLFLSTLSLRRATGVRQRCGYCSIDFYPRSPCGERRRPFRPFLRYNNFYPRSPCGERHRVGIFGNKPYHISIHALLAESDSSFYPANSQRGHFYPRSPCGERQGSGGHDLLPIVISIHALLAESDPQAFKFLQFKVPISIHALLAESDRSVGPCQLRQVDFYPRSPCGERLSRSAALCCISGFLSTLSLRRATLPRLPQPCPATYFYPRSPCGERLWTDKESTADFSDFYPRSPCGERRRRGANRWRAQNFYPRSPCGERHIDCGFVGHGVQFLSTLSLRRATRQERYTHERDRISIHALLAESDSPFSQKTKTLHLFLSTLSLRRATAKVHKTVGHFCAYETNFMGIASSC